MITKYTIFIKESKDNNYQVLPFAWDDSSIYDEEYDYDRYSDEAHQLADKARIGILRNKDISLIVLDNNQNLIGASFNNIQFLYPGSDFSFDIVVDENHQNKGIGIELIKREIETYNDLSSYGYDDVDLVLEVVNEKMKNILIKHFNFEVIQKIRDGYWIMKKKK